MVEHHAMYNVHLDTMLIHRLFLAEMDNGFLSMHANVIHVLILLAKMVEDAPEDSVVLINVTAQHVMKEQTARLRKLAQ